MTPYQKPDSSSAYIHLKKTILPNFIPIRFETSFEARRSNKSNKKRKNKMSCDTASVPDQKINKNRQEQ